jgi:nucleotide-binding universal stress UspA family protein
LSSHRPPFQRIGVCVDDSPAAGAALDSARSLRPPGGELWLVHVVEPPSFLLELAAGIGGGMVSDIDTLVAAATAWLESLADNGEHVVVLQGNSAAEVANWARTAECDLLVMAAMSDPATRSVLGSFSQRLTHSAPCSTLLVHPSEKGSGSVD